MTTCIASQMEAKTDAVNLFDCKDMDYFLIYQIFLQLFLEKIEKR